MATNPILEELYRVREEYAREFQFDLQLLCRDLQKKQHEFGGPVVSLPPKRLATRPTNTADAKPPVVVAAPT